MSYFRRKQNAQQLTEFNMHKWIRALQNLEDYHLGPEITGPKPQVNEEKKEEAPEKPETSQAAIEEEQEKRKVEAEKDLVFERAGDLLSGFKKLNVKIHFMTENLEGIAKRKKFEGLFDVVVLGLLLQQEVKSPALKKVLNEKGKVVQESAYFIVPIERSTRAEALQKFKKDAEESGFTVDNETSNNHFVIYQAKSMEPTK